MRIEVIKPFNHLMSVLNIAICISEMVHKRFLFLGRDILVVRDFLFGILGVIAFVVMHIKMELIMV